MSQSKLSVILLAAGEGKRMHSALPKVLHPLAGIPLIEHVLKTIQPLKAHATYIVYNPKQPEVREKLLSYKIEWIKQSEPLGTGHAVLQVLKHLDPKDNVLILYGDVPLTSLETLQNLVENAQSNEIRLLTTTLEDPLGRGRIIRNENGEFEKIVEERDTTPQEHLIQEINSGIYLIPAHYLQKWVPKIKNQNAQKEYYLPDILPMAQNEGVKIQTFSATSPMEVWGINDPMQLAKAERHYQHQKALHYMKQGLHLIDPNRFDLRGELVFGKDVTIDINVILEGKVTIGSNCTIGPNVVLRNVVISDHVQILANSFIEDTVIEDHCSIGPFARMRPGTRICSHALVGNFAEIKKSTVGPYSKVHHVSYIGDTTIGRDVNIGAGTITCNYNGATKHPTIIGDRAFIGSLSALVAPVTIGEEATIGAGSIITQDAPPYKLTLGRAKQITIGNWKRPVKK